MNMTVMASDSSRLVSLEAKAATFSPDLLEKSGAYEELRFTLDRNIGVFRTIFTHTQRSNFTETMLDELLRMQTDLPRLFNTYSADGERPFRYFVTSSDVKNIFSFGGDLIRFVELLAAEDAEGMRRYAYKCIQTVYNNYRNYDLPVTTIALVQGDALGGGLEAALSFDVVIAERSAQMGTPEIIFGLFPGMGAYNLISRKVSSRLAEHMMMSGRVYSAAELYDAGLVDVLAEDGEGETALRDYLHTHDKRYDARRAIHKMQRTVNPMTYEELERIADDWVETAMSLSSTDMKKMRRLARAQALKAKRDENADTNTSASG